MKVNTESKFARANIEAFYREAGLVFILDAFVIALIWLAFLFYGNPKEDEIDQAVLFAVIFMVPYLIFSYFSHHRIAILGFIDTKREDVIKRSAEIYRYKSSDITYSKSYKSVMSLLFPKEMDVDRYKVYYLDEAGKKRFFRLVMSRKKDGIFFDSFIWHKPSQPVEIYYLKRSKVLVSIQLISGEIYDSRTQYGVFEMNRGI